MQSTAPQKQKLSKPLYPDVAPSPVVFIDKGHTQPASQLSTTVKGT